MDDVCLIVESNGQLLTAGIPSYAYDLISEMNEIRFAVVTIAHRPYAVNSLVAKLPDNVTTLINVSLDEELLPAKKTPLRKKRKEFWEQLSRLYSAPLEEKTRYCEAVLQGLAHDEFRVQSYADIVRAGEFWEILCAQYERYCKSIPFLDYVWIFRFTQLPFFQLMQMDLPPAKVYHVFSSRYAGCAGLVAKSRRQCHFIFDVREDFFLDESLSFSEAVSPRQAALLKGLSPLLLDAFIKTYNATLKTIQYLAAFYADTIISPRKSGDLPVLKQEMEYKHLVIPAGSVRVQENSEKIRVKEKLSIGLVSDMTVDSDTKSFIRACRILLDEISDVSFTILVSPNIDRAYVEECIELKNQLGLEFALGIFYNGQTETRISELDAVVFSGGSLNARKAILFNALKSGKPLIATQRGIYPDIIYGHSHEDQALGECGICVESGSPEQLARAMLVIIQDTKLAREMGKIAQRRFEQFYSRSMHLHSYLSLYKNYI
jgi:glycosyltransferase involved in cell wall biosynthesis